MTVYQISVFMENKEGRVKKVINALGKANINIRALSIGDSSKYGILRLIVSDNEKAIEVLEKEGFIVKESEIIIVKINDEPNSLNSVLEILDDAKINVEYLYAFITNIVDKAFVAMKFEDMKKGETVLKENNANLITLKEFKEL